MATCPECDALLEVEEDDVEEGEVINCPDCGAELEIVNTSPVEVEKIEEEAEEEEELGEDLDEDEE